MIQHRQLGKWIDIEHTAQTQDEKDEILKSCLSLVSVNFISAILYRVALGSLTVVEGGTIRTGLTSWFKCTPKIGSGWDAMGAIMLQKKIFH